MTNNIEKMKKAAAALARAEEFTEGRHFAFSLDEMQLCARQDTPDGLLLAFQLGYMRGYQTGRRHGK